MFNPKRAWLYYCYNRNHYLEEREVPFCNFYHEYDLSPKHRRDLRRMFITAVKKEFRGEITNYRKLLKHFDYIW